MEIPDRIAQEVGKIIEQHNGILPRDITIRVIENSKKDQTEDVGDLELEVKNSSCEDEHLLLFIQSRFFESRSIAVNITIECDLEETERQLSEEYESHFNRTLFVLLYIPICFPIFKYFFCQNEEETIERELIRIHSSKSLTKKYQKSKSEGDSLKNYDRVDISKLGSIEEFDESHNFLIRVLVKLFYVITGVCLIDGSTGSPFSATIKPYFEMVISKIGNILTNKPSEKLEDCSCPENLYSTDEASDGEADFAGDDSAQLGGGKAKKTRKVEGNSVS